jgi:molecular chaperone DnaK
VELSSKSEVTVSIPCFSTSAQGPVDLNITLSRLEFENLVDKLIGDIKSKCQNVLEDAKISTKDIMEIVLVGGMSRVPKIQRIVCEVFGQNLQIKVSPEEAVVIGSAIHAALIVQDEQEITDNMIPLSIGIESSRGIFTRIIPRYSTIPAKQTVKIPAWVAYGERKPVKVFWGEHVMVKHNIHLGEIEVTKNRRSPYGCVDLELTFEVDKNFVVKVTAKCDDDDGSIFAFPIAQKDRSKENVNKAVKKALLDWRMSSREIHARLKNLARHAINTLCDVLSAKKDELPDDLYKEAAQVLAGLKKSLDGDVDVLRASVLTANSMRSKILNCLPPSQYRDSEDTDYE